MDPSVTASSGMDGFEVYASPELVEGWAPRRLPFEPKGLMLDYRNAIRDALRRLHPTRAYCAYTSTDACPCDIENVLLYNVGLAAFSHLAATEVVVERLLAPPPARPDGGMAAEHHHLYELSSRAATPGTATLATWPMTDVDPPWTVERIWSALRRSIQPRGSADPALTRLSLEVALEQPPSSRNPTALSAMKVGVDAMIASLHAHDGSHADEIARRLATRLPRSEREIATELMDDSRAVLGRRRLLWLFGRFVQWNPADDCLDFIRVTARCGGTWRVGGRLLVKTSITVPARPQQGIGH